MKNESIEQIAQRLYGKSYAELSSEDRATVHAAESLHRLQGNSDTQPVAVAQTPAPRRYSPNVNSEFFGKSIREQREQEAAS